MTTFTCSYKIMADRDNNRLYMILKGFVMDEYVRRVVEKIRCEVHKLKAGFDVISDVSQLKAATMDDARRILTAQQQAVRKGARRVISVAKPFEFCTSKNIESIVVDSIEQAENV